MNIDLLLMLATLVNRAVEAIKRLPIFERVPEAWRDEVLLVVSTVFGVAAKFALAPDQNLFAGSGVPEWAGNVFTGVVIAAGSNAIHYFVDLINKRAEPLNTHVNINAESGDISAANKIVEAVQEQQAA